MPVAYSLPPWSEDDYNRKHCHVVKTVTLSLALVLPTTIGSAAGPALAVTMPDVMDVMCLARDTLSHYLDRTYSEGRIAIRLGPDHGAQGG